MSKWQIVIDGRLKEVVKAATAQAARKEYLASHPEIEKSRLKVRAHFCFD